MTPYDLVGIPFKKFGTNPKDGFDCYGLVVWVYKHFYHTDIPTYNHDIIDAFNGEQIHEIIKRNEKDWESIENPTEPSVVLIRNHPVFVNHIGVYIGRGNFLHSIEKTGVIVSKLHDRYWGKKIVGFLKWKR